MASFSKSDRPLDFALAYARRGWSVLPIHTPLFPEDADGRVAGCSCKDPDCEKVGKHPRLDLKDATKSAKKIKQLWKETPDANVGILTGPNSDLFVIDVEASAEATFARLQQEFGEISMTLSIKTGGDGTFILFRYPRGIALPSARNSIAQGVSTLGEVGYIVAPPSLHVSSNAYEWYGDSDLPVAELPEWVSKLLTTEHGSEFDPMPGSESPAGPVLEDASESPEADPFYVCSNDVVAGQRSAALKQFAAELVSSGVRGDTVRVLTEDFNRQHAKPQLPHREVVQILEDVDKEEEEKKVERIKRRGDAELGVHGAVDAYLKSLFSTARFDDDAGEIEATWNATGAVVRLPVGGRDASGLQAALRRYAGSIESLAYAANDKATAKHIMRVLLDWVPKLPELERTLERSSHVTLVETLLATTAWITTTHPDGSESKGTQTIEQSKGRFHATLGIGVIIDKQGMEWLVCHFPTIANGVLKGGQFRGKTSLQLTQLFRLAPGYVGEKRFQAVRKTDIGDTICHAIDLKAFRAEVDATRPEGATVIEMPAFRNQSPNSPKDEKDEESPRIMRDLLGEKVGEHR